MSSLWRRSVTVDKVVFKIKPSPTCNNKVFSNVKFFPLSPFIMKFYSRFIEGTSPFISRLVSKKRVGSMTVEASCLLPLLLFFFLHLTAGMEMMRLHGHLAFALREAGSHLTLYAFAQEQLEAEIPGIAVSYLYVQAQVEALLGEEYLESSPLVHGSRGINYLASEYLGEEECIDIAATYQAAPLLTLFPFPYMRMVNRYYGRAWTGFDVERYAEEEYYRYVYITEYGSVWHATPECSYLNIQVQTVAYGDVGSRRNESGERYRRCELCDDYEVGENVYLTADGKRYHAIAGCSALVRRVRAVLWQEDLAYRPCSRCAG